MKQLLAKYYNSLSANALVCLWLAIWGIANVITSGASELSDDEAYYHMYALNLAWGYFDHPPITALLIWLGESIFNGEMGVRFFFNLLQPLYLYIFWCTIRPKEATRCDASLYVMISAAMLILQLYGLVAVPDGPLLMFSALYLLSLKRMGEDRSLSWLLMGVSLGLLALSKYHGALVLLFALIPNIVWLWRNPRKIGEMALAGVVALIIILPHLWWQYNHDWISFTYHLLTRNGHFSWGYVAEFIGNMLVVYSPFYLPLWVQAYRKVKATNPVERAIKFYPIAFITFFVLSSLRGYVQPQWTIVSVFGFIWLLFEYARHHNRTRHYVMRMGWITLALIFIVRIALMFNPFGLIRFEVFDNKTSYGQIAEIAAGRPVVFGHDYYPAAKYMFYTQGEAYAQSNAYYRTSQWQYRDDDTEFIGKQVILHVDPTTLTHEERTSQLKSITLANGDVFNYIIMNNFQPVRKVIISSEDFQLPAEVAKGDKFNFTLKLENPYPYDLVVDNRDLSLDIVWTKRKQITYMFALTDSFTLPANGSIDVECDFEIPNSINSQSYNVGFALHNRKMFTWFNSPIDYTELK
jgi:hypothetical protein